jgi:hypothetical protein
MCTLRPRVSHRPPHDPAEGCDHGSESHPDDFWQSFLGFEAIHLILICGPYIGLCGAQWARHQPWPGLLLGQAASASKRGRAPTGSIPLRRTAAYP